MAGIYRLKTIRHQRVRALAATGFTARFAFNHRRGDGKRAEAHLTGQRKAQLAVLTTNNDGRASRVCPTARAEGKRLWLYQAALDQLCGQKQDKASHLMLQPADMEEQPVHKSALNFWRVSCVIHMVTGMALMARNIGLQPRCNVCRGSGGWGICARLGHDGKYAAGAQELDCFLFVRFAPDQVRGLAMSHDVFMASSGHCKRGQCGSWSPVTRTGEAPCV